MWLSHWATSTAPWANKVTDDGSRLSFLVERELQDVFLSELEEDGTRLGPTRRLTLDDRRDTPSGWSSDSGSVFFHSDRAGSRNPYRFDLDATSPGSLHIGPDDGWNSRQSADGAWILFWYGDELMRIPTSGGPPELVLTGEQSNSSRFDCALGQRCLVGMRVVDDNEYVFYELDPVNGRGDELARIEDHPPFIQWALSPDGSTVAVAHNTGVVRLVDLASGMVRDVRHDEWALHEFVTWDANGRGVYIDARPWTLGPRGRYTGRKELVYVRLGDKVDVFPLRRGEEQMHLRSTASPDGRYLAFGVMTISANAWMLEHF